MRATPLMLAIALGLGTAWLPAVAANPAGPRAGERVDDLRTWIVVFDEPAAAAFRGFGTDSRRPKLAATSPVVAPGDRYDAKSAAAIAYVDYLADLRRARLAEVSERLGREVVPRTVYVHATNGVALALTAREAALVGAMPGVRAVRPDFSRRVLTSTSPQWIGADEIWNGTLPGVGAHRGEGIVIGVIDTGINRTHTAFSGAGISNPKPGYLGYCATVASACTSKLIGLWDFIADLADGEADPVDNNGHGTHTASTAAGNPFSSLSGVAPRANLIAYKACATDNCDFSALLKSIDQAVDDGVDVISYSIGGSPEDPWLALPYSDYRDESEAFLAAREAGIVIAAAAGNEGPDPGSLSSPSNAPWVMSVANATDDGGGIATSDRLADSSGRGPVVPFGVVKPDLTAPGTQIQAAGITSPTSSATMSGTSMATPHVAGAAALLLSAVPSRTADQVISALTLTARNTIKIGTTLADPHEQGAGMLDVARAARAGLYLQMGANALRDADADPYAGIDGLNLPTLGDGACFDTCTLSRTFKLMPGASAASYTVSVDVDTAGATVTPSVTSFTSSAGGTTIDFVVDVGAPELLNRWVYGWVMLTNTSGDGRPDLRLPLAVFATPYEDAATEAALTSNATRTVGGERGYFDIPVGGTVALPDARFATTALVVPTRTTQTIAADPTPDEPHDSAVGTYRRTFSAPTTAAPTTYRIAASTRAASGDIDLYVGRDTDGDGLPEASEELCRSTSADANEDCSFEITLTTGATFWLVAQNWDGTDAAVAVDSSVLALTPADTPQLTATGPGHVPVGTPFSIRIAYDDPTMIHGQRRVGALLVQRTPGSTVISMPFTLERSGTASPAFGLAPGVARRVSLPVGAAHDRLYVDIPPGATQVRFRTINGSGSVSLYAARTAIPAGPGVAAAPARGSADHVAAAAGANQTITLTGAQAQAGRWYLTPVNTGSGVASVDVVATIDAVAAVPALQRGSYYNPSRGGHGLFLYPSGSQHALLWYTYLQDGTPTWYYAQASQPGADQVWNGTVYRAAWNGTSRILEAIGNLVLTPRATGQLSLTYNIDGFTGAETLDTFLTGCPMHAGAPLDVSAHWYDTVSPGYGYSVQVNPDYEFLATFVYDGHGVPRFLTAERAGAFQGGNSEVPLYQLLGFAPLAPHQTPARSTVGQLTRTYGAGTIESIGATATFVDGVPGSWSRDADVTRLSSFTQGCD